MQDIKAKISLVMATYNGEKYIIEQLDSIKNQTRSADEVIIADDCSTDATVEIIEKYITENNLSSSWRLVVNPVNKGWQKNFMDLINMATGDIIFLSDQDDICLPNKFERMTDVLLQTPNATLLACSQSTKLEKNSLKSGCSYRMEDKLYGKNVVAQVKFDRTWPQCCRLGCCFCFKREVIPIATELWREACPHDWLIWGLVLTKGQVYILNERLHLHRIHHNNTSTFNSAKTLKKRVLMQNWCIGIADSILQHKDELALSTKVVKRIKRQRAFYAMRVKAMSNKNIFLLMFLLTKIHLYPKYLVSWVADVISTFR